MFITFCKEFVQFSIRPRSKIYNSSAAMHTVPAIAGWRHLVPVLGAGVGDVDLYGLGPLHSFFIIKQTYFYITRLGKLYSKYNRI